MKTIPSIIPPPKVSRCWTVSEIPQPDPDDLGELEIIVNYVGPGDIASAIPLDDFVVPLFKLAPRLLEVVHNLGGFNLAIMGLTPEEITEVKRLSGVNINVKSPPTGATEKEVEK